MNSLFGLSSETNLFPRVIFLLFILRVGESIDRIYWKVKQTEVQQEMIFYKKLALVRKILQKTNILLPDTHT